MVCWQVQPVYVLPPAALVWNSKECCTQQHLSMAFFTCLFLPENVATIRHRADSYITALYKREHNKHQLHTKFKRQKNQLSLENIIKIIFFVQLHFNYNIIYGWTALLCPHTHNQKPTFALWKQILGFSAIQTLNEAAIIINRNPTLILWLWRTEAEGHRKFPLFLLMSRLLPPTPSVSDVTSCCFRWCISLPARRTTSRPSRPCLNWLPR